MEKNNRELSNEKKKKFKNVNLYICDYLLSVYFGD